MTIGKCRLVTAAVVLAWLLGSERLCAQVIDLPPVTGPSTLPGTTPPNPYRIRDARLPPGWLRSTGTDAKRWSPSAQTAEFPGARLARPQPPSPDPSVEVPNAVPQPLPPLVPLFPEQIEPENPDRPPDARDGVFQKLIFNSTWLDPGGANGLGMSELEWKTVLGFPVPSRRSPLVVTPGFAINYLEEPAGSDLPPRVYEGTMQFRWWKRFTPRFGIDFSVTPGVYSDFEQSTDEAIRTPGHVVGRFEWTPTVDLVLGAAYLDREDLDVLPIGGLIWNPHDDLKLEMVFPRPRVARRVYCFGAVEEAVQDWLYVAGEFGTKTWAIRRTGGANDVLTYRDCRLLLGVERKALGGLDTRFEVGYVFSREIEFVTSAPDLEPDDTVLLRAGLTY